jgi:hypothetical protein
MSIKNGTVVTQDTGRCQFTIRYFDFHWNELSDLRCEDVDPEEAGRLTVAWAEMKLLRYDPDTALFHPLRAADVMQVEVQS